ncbi:hypothetical protein DWG95_19345 [Escherichia coli]|nr:hypothetical protein [Escherichia coli]EGD4401016.1 hypothetical protein [Escherichia coli]
MPRCKTHTTHRRSWRFTVKRLLKRVREACGAALNGVKAVSGSVLRVTIPALLQIAFLRRIVNTTQV